MYLMQGMFMSKLRQMEVFVAVVEAGSFADAAHAVGMSAVMVGRHIQSLEKTLNTKLIQRTTRRQSITTEGRLFYEEAKLALEQVKYAFSRVEASNPEPSGLLRITAPMSLGVSLVGPLVAEFMQLYPQIQVELILSNEVVDLYETSFDLAFRISELIGVNLLAKPLPPYRMVICASPAYLQKWQEPTSPEDLHRHRILTHTSWNNRFAWPLRNGASEVPWPESAVLKSNAQVEGVCGFCGGAVGDVANVKTLSRAGSLPQGICEQRRSNVGASLLAMNDNSVSSLVTKHRNPPIQ
jgi:DNA-binding transcriptional LysR family regulator